MGRRPNKINNATISVDTKIIGFSDNYSLNERFEVRKVSVLSWEEYGNRFHFNKPLIDSKDYQLDMLPVVGFHNGDEFTSHDEKTVPYGAVIPGSARWEIVDDKEYKIVDVAFWKGRYSELDDLKSCNQSMEIVNISGIYNKELGIFEAEDYTYDALCVLGENVIPAYSKARVFNLSDIKDEFDMFKKEFSALINANKTEEGVDRVENENIENVVDEFNKPQDNTTDGDVFESNEKPNNHEDARVFELSHDDIRSHIFWQLNPMDDDGFREWNFWVMEVFDTYFVCQTETEPNKYYKFTFSKTQDPEGVVVDMDSKTELFVTYLTQEEKDMLNKKDEQFEQLVTNCENLTNENKELKQFKLDVEDEKAKELAEFELKAKKEEVEKFSTKLSKKEVGELIDDVNKFSLEEIKTKLSVALADKLLAEKELFNENTIMNIDNTDKTYSRSERLLAELKSKHK